MWPPGVPWATWLTVHVAAQRMATVVPPPSIDTSRSPSSTPAETSAADESRRRLSVPGNGLLAVPAVGEVGGATGAEARRDEANALDAGVTACG